MRWIVLPAVVAACMLAVAGCGGSSSESSAGDEVTAVETDVESTSTDEMEHSDTTEAEDTSTTEDTTGGVDLSGSNLSDECKDLVQASAKYSQAFGSVASGGDLDLQEASKALQGVADAAPSEIRGAYQTLAAAIGKYAEALEGVDLSSGKTPDPATIAKITQAAQSFDNAEVTKATQEISTWTTEHCGAP